MSVQDSMAWRVEQLTDRKLDWLLNKAPDNTCKATLAELRRGIGRRPGDIPALWSILLQDMPADMQGQSMKPSRQENAVYTALTLFAVHQQGKTPRTEPMHLREQYFGCSVAKLAILQGEDGKERIERRFSQAATADDMTEFAYHLRGLVQLLSAKGIAIDWAKLAGQLYEYQNPDRVAAVRLRWGEDFYSELNRQSDAQKKEEDHNEE